MKNQGMETRIYHMTDIENLSAIVNAGGLVSDALMKERGDHHVIGFDHIKKRRLEKICIPHSGRFVGEYVPFYFCPRSPMLYTINEGNTGREKGCQRTILHLVSSVGHAVADNDDWAISDGNAATFCTSFYHRLDALNELNWGAIQARQWRGLQHEKAAEFLVADRFAWSNIIGIAVFDSQIEEAVKQILQGAKHRPAVKILRDWYY